MNLAWGFYILIKVAVFHKYSSNTSKFPGSTGQVPGKKSIDTFPFPEASSQSWIHKQLSMQENLVSVCLIRIFGGPIDRRCVDRTWGDKPSKASLSAYVPLSASFCISFQLSVVQLHLHLCHDSWYICIQDAPTYIKTQIYTFIYICVYA